MSEDEIFALLVCAGLTLFTWVRWAWVAASVRTLRTAPAAYGAAGMAVPVAAALLFAVLARFASHDVRDNGVYIGFYLVMGAAMVAVGVWLLDRLGLSLRDDVLERRNPAACFAWAGALIGLTLAFAGANIGDGPGWWVVVFSAGLSMGTVLAGWLIVDRVAHTGEAIVVERDLAKALRMAGWFVATGAVTGRAAAGNWVSAAATVRDFWKVGAGAILLIVCAAVGEAAVRARPDGGENAAARGLFGALAWVAAATGYLAWVGLW